MLRERRRSDVYEIEREIRSLFLWFLFIFFNEYSFDGMFEFVFSDSTTRKQQII